MASARWGLALVPDMGEVKTALRLVASGTVRRENWGWRGSCGFSISADTHAASQDPEGTHWGDGRRSPASKRLTRGMGSEEASWNAFCGPSFVITTIEYVNRILIMF